MVVSKQKLIYGLRDPRTMEIRYVGKSSKGLYRPKQHTSPTTIEKDNTHKGRWVRKLVRLGLRPEIVVLQIICDESLIEAEKFWIAIGKQALGKRFTNQTDGGEGTPGWVPTEENKRNITNGIRKAYQNPEVRERSRRAQIESNKRPEIKEKRRLYWNRPEMKERSKRLSLEAYQRSDVIERHQEATRKAHSSPEVREKHSKASRINFARPEVKAKLSASLKSANATLETKERRRVARKNWDRNPELKEKHREACREAQNRPEVKEKQRLAVAGRLIDDRWKGKMSVSAKLRWERERIDKNKELFLSLIQSLDAVSKQDDKWWFCDVIAKKHGPYDTETEARTELRKYCDSIKSSVPSTNKQSA